MESRWRILSKDFEILPKKNIWLWLVDVDTSEVVLPKVEIMFYARERQACILTSGKKMDSMG